MDIPDYSNPKTGGSMIRAACWLASEIGEGNPFTKEALRAALPGVAQIDRRVRDLRKFGWVIEEARTGSGLGTNEQRLAKIGVHVWDKKARDGAKVPTISAKVREEVFHRDGHACRRCGIAAGEPFDDEGSVVARLTAGHVYPDSLGSKATASDLITTCQRCNESVQNQTRNYFSLDQLIERAHSLSMEDRQDLVSWIEADRRYVSDVEQLWRDFRQLPAAERVKFSERFEGAEETKTLGRTELESLVEKVRNSVLERDLFSCVRCGNVAKEIGEDLKPVTLQIKPIVNGNSRSQPRDASDFVTECSSCSEGVSSAGRLLTGEQLEVRIQALGRDEREDLYKRIESGRRSQTRVDQIWAIYRQSPVKTKEKLRNFLENLLGID